MIEIRAFQRQDGEGISALFRTVYGDRYVYPDIYMPSLIYSARKNLISF